MRMGGTWGFSIVKRDMGIWPRMLRKFRIQIGHLGIGPSLYNKKINKNCFKHFV